ncbi:oligosaccharide flippase family protein [Haemophilus sp. SZY H57]
MTQKLSGKDYKKLLSNFFSLASLQIVTYVLPLLTLPYLVRCLEVERFGLVSFAQSIMVFFILLVDYGFDLSATKDISQNRNNKEKLTEIFSAIICIKVLLNLVCLVLLGLIIFYFNKFRNDYLLYFTSYLLVIGQSLFPTWYFQGMESMRNISIINISSKVLFTVLIFVFVSNKDDYLLVPFFNGVGALLATLYAFYIVRTKFKQKFVPQNRNVLLRYFKDSSSYFLSRISISLFTSINIAILGLTTNNTTVGYYSIAEKLYQALQRAYSPISQVLYPFISRVKDVSLVRRTLYVLVPLNILAICIIYLFDNKIFEFLFQQEVTTESVSIFHILLLSIMITLPSSIIGYPLLGALGFSKQVNLGIICSSMFHLVGLLVLYVTGELTIYTVAYMVVMTEFSILIVRVFFIYRYRVWSYDGAIIKND